MDGGGAEIRSLDRPRLRVEGNGRIQRFQRSRMVPRQPERDSEADELPGSLGNRSRPSQRKCAVPFGAR